MPKDTTAEVDVWEFVKMVDAAVFSSLNQDTEVSEEFPEYVWQVYQVIERRVENSENTVLLAVPSVNKKQSVKHIAKQCESGFDDDERQEQAKKYYGAVPLGRRKNRFRQEESDQNQYQM